MENKINLVEVLKDCPSGMELNCTMFERVEFDGIVDNEQLPIRCRIKNPDGGYNVYNFTKHGNWIDTAFAKCVIFPKGKTTWEGFHRPFKDGDIISDGFFDTICIFKGEGRIKGTVDFYCGISDTDELFIKDVKDQDEHFGEIYEYKFATEEEKEKLFNAIKDNGYKWNAETKTLETLVTAEDLQPYKEYTVKENLTIQDIRNNNAEWLLNKLQEMSDEGALQTICNLYGELHKPQYPKTYEECCKVLGIDSDNFLSIRNLYRYHGDEESTDYESDLLDKFEYLWELTICRDAYWKIIGEQMGLGEPWKPVYTDDNIKYCITTHKNRLDFNGTIERNYVLIFPTKEIKNAFYENFKELIEKCKELL